MKTINARVTYTVNNGADQTADVAVSVPDDLQDDAIGRYTVASLAADQLIEKGQIMVSGAQFLETAEEAAA
jgi:hypothetical protein